MTMPRPYPNDLVHASRRGAENVPLDPRGGELHRWRDEWGVTWASLTDYDKGEVVEPAIRDWGELDDYQPPDLGPKEDYAEAAARFAADTEHFRVGGLPGFTFNVARKLRKLENYLCDLILEPQQVRRLNEIVRNELLKGIDRLAEAGADAIMFCEDWGTQDRLMIEPAMWREVFRPEFELLAGRARDHGLYVLMHSCGKTTDIIGDLIECGVACLQFDHAHRRAGQPRRGVRRRLLRRQRGYWPDAGRPGHRLQGVRRVRLVRGCRLNGSARSGRHPNGAASGCERVNAPASSRWWLATSIAIPIAHGPSRDGAKSRKRVFLGWIAVMSDPTP